MQLNQLIAEYEELLQLQTVQQVRVNESKKQDLLSYFKATTSLIKIDQKAIKSYILHLKNKGNKPATIRVKVSYLKTLLTYALKCNYIDHLPYIPIIKKQQAAISLVSYKEILQMLKWCKENKETELRVALLLAYYTGARINNILSITSKNIDNGYLRIWINKSKKPYSIPIKKRIYPILNENFKGFTLNYQNIYYRFFKMKQELGLDENITIHSLRHTFCSRCIEKGIDLRTTQLLAGHRCISTTAGYVHIKNKQLEDAISKI